MALHTIPLHQLCFGSINECLKAFSLMLFCQIHVDAAYMNTNTIANQYIIIDSYLFIICNYANNKLIKY